MSGASAGPLGVEVSHLHGIIEFTPVSRYAAILGQDSTIEHDDHECLIRYALPLTVKVVLRCKLKAKAWVILGVAQNNNEWTARLA